MATDSEFITRREARIRARALRMALKLQAQKYESRLRQLNGEHRTNIENWLQSVRKDLFDQFKAATDEKIARLQQKEDQRAGRNALFQLLAASGGLSLLYNVAHSMGWIK